MMRAILYSLSAALVAAAVSACAADDPIDGENAGFGDGKADGQLSEGSPEAIAVLRLVNDPAVSLAVLDDDAGLHATAAANIIAHRDGPDARPATGDDDLFDSLAELDRVKFVGPIALRRLLALAVDRGLLGAARDVDVIFSPQPIASSHNARVAELIANAQHSIDIAMYSFSDAAISDALAAAVARGVSVRFIFETASEDRKLDSDDLARSKSGRLEAAGIDVRWVNKIMHHKFMIVDGPRDDLDAADSATVVTGSANWSFGGATIYDENTLFLSGYPELTLRLQREYDLMWEHSRDLVANPDLELVVSTLDITDNAIPDDPAVDAVFTSANFSASDDTFRVDKSSTVVADRLVAAIEAADSSILIASGHLRSRPVAEALAAKAAERPDMDIRVYLDGQEYISASGHAAQERDVDACLQDATTDGQIRDCLDSGFLFGFQVGEAGVDVRYKLYAYRWDFSYAVQMHHKYLIVDGDTLFTGSYNLSMNAEHDTFENMLTFTGPEHAGLVARYRANFEALWDTGRDDGLLDALLDRVANDDTFPIVFDPMALTWQEVTDLKAAIRDACPQVDSQEFRTDAAGHKLCIK